MSLDPADRVRFSHMRDAAREALVFSTGRDLHSLQTDALYRRAVLHCIQEIGEAAARVSEEARLNAPQVPWKQIIGMRNRLVHVYFNMDERLVWEVLSRDLKPLIEAVEAVLTQV